jgi:hypothetical protein
MLPSIRGHKLAMQRAKLAGTSFPRDFWPNLTPRVVVSMSDVVADQA